MSRFCYLQYEKWKEMTKARVRKAQEKGTMDYVWSYQLEKSMKKRLVQ